MEPGNTVDSRLSQLTGRTGVAVDPSLQSAVRRMVILLVEDDSDTPQSLCALLEHWGARVICASSAAEALRLAGAGFHYDCVVSDLELPGADSLWPVSEIWRRARPTAPAPWAIFLTDSARPGIERSAIRAGFDLCLKKPVGADSLLRAIVRQRGGNLSELPARRPGEY